jgi:hypothetical protein
MSPNTCCAVSARWKQRPRSPVARTAGWTSRGGDERSMVAASRGTRAAIEPEGERNRRRFCRGACRLASRMTSVSASGLPIAAALSASKSWMCHQCPRSAGHAHPRPGAEVVADPGPRAGRAESPRGRAAESPLFAKQVRDLRKRVKDGQRRMQALNHGDLPIGDV